jgi:hypothetical protein
MNDTHDHQANPSQTDPPQRALRRALEHVLVFLKAFFTGSWGLTKEYAPKAWDGVKLLLLLRTRALIMASRARTEGRVKDKAADGQLEIDTAKAKAIVLEAEGKKALRVALAEQVRIKARATARISDAKAKRHMALAARPRQGPKPPKREAKPEKVAALESSQTPAPATHGTNGHVADVNKMLQPEA